MSQTFCFGESIEIEDRITNTEFVVSDGRVRSHSVMIPRLARKYSVDTKDGGVHSKVRHIKAWAS